MHHNGRGEQRTEHYLFNHSFYYVKASNGSFSSHEQLQPACPGSQYGIISSCNTSPLEKSSANRMEILQKFSYSFPFCKKQEAEMGILLENR